ncbi:MAG TPA: TonB-dependent receptor, partial [Bacteroidales bacterium]|nr:TonB-dependent receptor [Bacteroidales bacterium]
IAGHANELSIGADLYAQPARTENYENINGKKGDQLQQLLKEKINNTGFYFSENFEIFKEKIFLLITGRYDVIAYKLAEETLPSRSDNRKFDAFTPKFALNFKLTPSVSVYTSYGFSFDSPANNEMDSFDPQFLYNSELKPQKSKNFEIGVKGNLNERETGFLRKIQFEATFFNIIVENEIVPLEYLGDVFFRNAAKTRRTGVEFGARTEIIKDLTFSVSYTWSDFRYKNYSARTIEADSLGNYIISEKDFSGNIVPSVPQNNLYLSLAYARPVSKQLSFLAKASYMNISGMWVDDANTDKTAAYNLFNTLIGLDLRLWKFDFLLSGGVNNLFDEVYVGFTNTNSANKRFYEAGSPRDFFVSLNIGFQF